jgi:hypothetical protein
MGWHRFETNDNKRRLEHTQNVIYPTKIKTQTTISYCLVLKRRMVRPLFPTQSHPCDTCCQAQSPLLRLLGSKLKFICAGAAEERSNSVNDPPRYSQFSVLTNTNLDLVISNLSRRAREHGSLSVAEATPSTTSVSSSSSHHTIRLLRLSALLHCHRSSAALQSPLRRCRLPHPLLWASF